MTMKTCILSLTLYLILMFLLVIVARADSTAAVLDVGGRPICRVTVTNSQNPSQYPDGTYTFDMEWMQSQQLYCTYPVQGWTYIGTWMGV